MRIKKDVLTQKLVFVGIDSSDHIARKTALSSFTVYYSLNGGTATVMTTPTVAELDATNMAGDYTLLVDEAGMVSAAGELTLHITATGMDPVTRIVEITENFEADNYAIVAHADYGNAKLVRSTTPANSLDISATGEADVNITQLLGTAIATPTVNGVLEVDLTHIGGVAQSAADLKHFVDWCYDPATGFVSSNLVTMVGNAQTVTDLGDFADNCYDPTNNKVQSDLIYILGSALTETAGQLAAGFTKLFDVASPLLVASDVMRGTDSAYTGTPPSATAIIDEFETQSQADPTGFHINVLEVAGTAQTANDNGADLNTLLTRLSDARAEYLDNISGGSISLASDAAVDVVLETGLSQVNSQTSLNLASGSSNTGEYEDMSVIIYDTSNNKEGCRRKITAYGGVLKTMEIDLAPDFTVVDTDTVKIFEPSNSDDIPMVSEIRIEMDTNSTKMAPSQTLADYKATGFNTVVPDAAGIAAGLHTTTDALINGLNDITVADIIAGINDGTYDFEEIIRIIFSACALKTNGGGTNTLNFRNSADDKNRITETVDENGNRLSVTLDGSD